MIYLLEVQMSPPEVLWRENDSPFSLTIPHGERARGMITSLVGARDTDSRPTSIARGINLQRSFTPIIFAIFKPWTVFFLLNFYHKPMMKNMIIEVSQILKLKETFKCNGSF
jgi:hypothetical protein